MKQKINIAEILKDAPKGTKLWTDFYGPVVFAGFNKEGDSINLIANAEKGVSNYWVNIYGEYDHDIFPESACSVFPSKDNRDWSTFKAPWKHKHFEPLQPVLFARGYDITDTHKRIWTLAFYSHYEEDSSDYVLTNGLAISKNAFIIAYKGNESLVGKKVNI